MDRCALANEYNERGFNCTQSVLAAFGDLTHLPEKEALAIAGGLGGGIGGSRQELCGAIVGGVAVLGMLYPNTAGGNNEERKRVFQLSKEFRRRFEERFACTKCADLLAAKFKADDRFPAAQRLQVRTHCSIPIVTAVEILETMLQEQGVL